MNTIDKSVKNKFKFIPQQLDKMTICTRLGPEIIDSGLKSDMFNIIYCSGDEKRKNVEAAIAHFHSRALPFAWWTGFDSDPEWLEEELIAQGLKKSESELAMECTLSAVTLPPHEGVRIIPVTTAETVEDMLQVMLEIATPQEETAISTFFRQATPILIAPDTPLHFSVAYINSTPVAISSVFFSNGIASIFDVIVAKSMRGQGLGQLITLAAMQIAQNHNTHTCILTATGRAKDLYKKIGFNGVKEMSVYTD